jgi:hypothetical protein
MASAKKRILVTAKAYPNLSSKYDETVCTAGMDLDTGRFIRLWPVRFRYLAPERQFNKWDIIEVSVARKHDDPRGDTFVPDTDTLVVTTERYGRLPSGKIDWKARNELILPLVSTMELLDEQAKAWNGSLGLVRAIDPRLRVDAGDDVWGPKGQAILNRQTLFGDPPKPLDKIPWAFRYRYRCCGECCKSGHHQQVFDWEMSELYRGEVARLGEPGLARDSVLFKYNEQLGPSSRDIHFFVGTLRLRPDQFSIIGVYYPPRAIEPPPPSGQMAMDFD